jgi:hypothetical protein
MVEHDELKVLGLCPTGHSSPRPVSTCFCVDVKMQLLIMYITECCKMSHTTSIVKLNMNAKYFYIKQRVFSLNWQYCFYILNYLRHFQNMILLVFLYGCKTSPLIKNNGDWCCSRTGSRYYLDLSGWKWQEMVENCTMPSFSNLYF